MRLQAHTQALSILLATQQSRIVQLTARLDIVRKELVDAIVKARDAASFVSSEQAGVAREQDPQRRLQLDHNLRSFKAEADKAAAVEQALRMREADLLRDLQTEETRLADSIVRLEQLVRR